MNAVFVVLKPSGVTMLIAIVAVVTVEAKNTINSNNAAFRFNFSPPFFVFSSHNNPYWDGKEKSYMELSSRRLLVPVLESELFGEMQRMIVKNFLDILILMELRKDSLSGYDIMRLLHRKLSVMLSSGTVYSRLYNLERNKLTEGMGTKKKRVYRLTEEGEKTVKDFLELKDKMLDFTINLFT